MESTLNPVNNGSLVKKIDNKQPLDKTLSNFVLFWNDAMKKNKNATSTLIFEYINLRYGNNIFYATK